MLIKVKHTRILFSCWLLFNISVISGAAFNQSDASFCITAKLSNVQFDYKDIINNSTCSERQVCSTITLTTGHISCDKLPTNHGKITNSTTGHSKEMLLLVYGNTRCSKSIHSKFTSNYLHVCCEQVLFLAASVCLCVCPHKISKTTDQKLM